MSMSELQDAEAQERFDIASSPSAGPAGTPRQWVDRSVMVASALGSLATALTCFLVWLQLGQLQVAIRQSSNAAVYQHTFNVQKHIADNPYFTKNLYKESPQFSSEDERLKFEATLEMVADYYEHIILENLYIEPEEQGYWIMYLRSQYSQSPPLRRFLHEHAGSYSPKLLRVFDDKGLMAEWSKQTGSKDYN